MAALDAFKGVNYRYRNIARNNQCHYKSSLVEKLVSAPKLFHSYIRKRKGCPTVGPLKSEHGRIMSNSSDMSESLAHPFFWSLLRVLLTLLSTRVLLASWMKLLCLFRLFLRFRLS